MQTEDCYQIGYITKTHGTKGEAILFLDVDYPEDYEGLESLFLEIKGELVPYFVQNINIQKESRAIVKFEGINSIEAAKTLVGSSAYLPDDVLEELDETTFYYHEIVGFQVEDAKLGKLGKVTGVYSMSVQDLIAMQFQGKEVLIPVNEDIVPKVNREQKTLYVNLPEGLVEIYTSDEKQTPDDGD